MTGSGSSRVRTAGEVRSFFLNADGTEVYEAAQVDLTAQDVEQSVGFGQYWKPFSYWANGVYVPDQSLALSRVEVSFTKYTADQMKRNLFIDPTTTKMMEDSQDGAQIYTDTKRGLKVEQGGGWLSYKDPVARAEGRDDPAENITSAVQFVNQHGGMERDVSPDASAGHDRGGRRRPVDTVPAILRRCTAPLRRRIQVRLYAACRAAGRRQLL
ncbi:two-component system activity regulator YycH [Cohnella rhizosphaerae]|uniref:two-component system activity regulator YycH n=1 Tax=Cohnella rhizosphaerae TaxID=1457232 RepID=UPI0030B8DC29